MSNISTPTKVAIALVLCMVMVGSATVSIYSWIEMKKMESSMDGLIDNYVVVSTQLEEINEREQPLNYKLEKPDGRKNMDWYMSYSPGTRFFAHVYETAEGRSYGMPVEFLPSRGWFASEVQYRDYLTNWTVGLTEISEEEFLRHYAYSGLMGGRNTQGRVIDASYSPADGVFDPVTPPTEGMLLDDIDVLEGGDLSVIDVEKEDRVVEEDGE